MRRRARPDDPSRAVAHSAPPRTASGARCLAFYGWGRGARPAGYRFGDYWKLGLPMVGVFFVVAIGLVPLV